MVRLTTLHCQYLTPLTIMFAVLRVSGSCGHPSVPLGSVIKDPGEDILCVSSSSLTMLNISNDIPGTYSVLHPDFILYLGEMPQPFLMSSMEGI